MNSFTPSHVHLFSSNLCICVMCVVCRFVANVADDQNILDKDSVTFWVTLNMCNFFFENVTEAIICGCLLFSGYNDIFLTMFAVPTIVNTSVRLCKVLVPLLVYTVCPFLWDCLVFVGGFLHDCFMALVGYFVNCFNFVLSDQRASAGERQHLELSNAYDGNDNNDNKSFRVLIHRIEVTNASQVDASRSNNLSCNVKYLGFTLR